MRQTEVSLEDADYRSSGSSSSKKANSRRMGNSIIVGAGAHRRYRSNSASPEAKDGNIRSAAQEERREIQAAISLLPTRCVIASKMRG